jgi:DNA-binding NarL/FixJ family response regulator
MRDGAPSGGGNNEGVEPALDPHPLAVLVVEDDRLLRESLRTLIAGSPGFTCAGTAASVEAALRLDLRPAPDLLLLDVGLPGLRGSAGVVPLRARWPHAQAVMHTIYEEDDAIFESLCNGAVGYVLKRTPPAELLAALRDAHAGGAPMSPVIARRVIGLFRRVAPRDSGAALLTPQEVRLLAELAEGASYSGAAAALDISLNTARTHIRSIYEKLHVHSRSEAVAKALRAGLI